jgi:hypothetical protein
MDRYTPIMRPAHRRPWTSEEDKLLANMVAEQEMIGEIAMVLGRTREAVRNRANLLGLSVQSSPGRGRRRLDDAGL